MNEEVDEILEKFNKNEETVEDVYKLKELADFYDEVGGPAYENMSDMVVRKAMAKFKELGFEDQLDFFMKYANKDVVDEVMKMLGKNNL